MNNEVRIETVRRLDLQTGDILHITLGGELGDGLGRWCPSHADLEAHRTLWTSVLPPDMAYVITHDLVDVEILRPTLNCSTWPPKVMA